MNSLFHLKNVETKRNIIYIEAIRIAAILMVIWNHTYEKGFWLFLDKTQDPFYYIYIAASVVCKAGVPLFFMMSGILLLGKEEPLMVILKKRVLRMSMALLLMGITMYLYGAYWTMHGHPEKYQVELPLNIMACIHDLYNGLHTEACWFIYSYIVFLLLLPFLRKLVKVVSGREFLYLGVIYFICTAILPSFEFIVFQGSWAYFKSFNFVDVLPWNIFYPLLGYYIAKLVPDDVYTTRNALWMLVLYISCLAISSIFISERFILLNLVKDELFHRFLLPVEVIALYVIFRTLFSTFSADGSIGTLLRFAGANTFGIYLWERILRFETMGAYSWCRSHGINELIAGYIWMLFLLIIGIIAVWLLRRLPILRKIL